MKNIFYIVVGFLLSTFSFRVSAYDLLGTNKIDDRFKNGGVDLVTKTDNILAYFIGLLYFLSVVIVVWGGFLILSSGGDEEKVKKGRKYIIYALVGLVVIFLASQFVNWIIDTMTSTDVVGKSPTKTNP